MIRVLTLVCCLFYGFSAYAEPKILHLNSETQKINNANESLDYLRSFKKKEGDLKLREVKKSLLGLHYHYDQILDGYPVSNAEIILSVSKEDKPYMIFDNLSDLTIKEVHRAKGCADRC